MAFPSCVRSSRARKWGRQAWRLVRSADVEGTRQGLVTKVTHRTSSLNDLGSRPDGAPARPSPLVRKAPMRTARAVMDTCRSWAPPAPSSPHQLRIGGASIRIWTWTVPERGVSQAAGDYEPSSRSASAIASSSIIAGPAAQAASMASGPSTARAVAFARSYVIRPAGDTRLPVRSHRLQARA